MKIYENIESERERIQNCIQKYGWTSDHNLDWFVYGKIKKDGIPTFVEFDDMSGLLVHRYSNEWRIWSDPLCNKENASEKISEFSQYAFKEGVGRVWCDDVSDVIYPELIKNNYLKIEDIYYSLSWPILNMETYDLNLPGGNLKEIRNARNKFYREHTLKSVDSIEFDKKNLHEIVENWKKAISAKEDIYDLKYHNAIENNFKGFITARVLVVDGNPVGFNAGYEVPNNPSRFAGVIGIHDYSIKDLGVISWLEDLEWIKKHNYKEVDLQGTENNQELKFKMQFGPIIERKTDCFSIIRR